MAHPITVSDERQWWRDRRGEPEAFPALTSSPVARQGKCRPMERRCGFGLADRIAGDSRSHWHKQSDAIEAHLIFNHHFVPIVGQAWIGIVPSDRVIGISKFNRIVDWVMSRPHIQEEAAIMVADTIEDLIKPKGLAFVIKAQHMCMTWRGVKEPETKMVNSIVRGSFRQDPSMKKEFFDLIRAHGFGD